ncbi:ferrous iron transport protein A [Candidatus Bathyarchaeota archaeon]|nr:ferrous iron transport protein A [Candidatus Bathyarchaeota archaeon]
MKGGYFIHPKKGTRQSNSDPPAEGKAVPLVRLREGEVGVVAYTVGGRGLVRRLAEMGLTPGVKVKVLRKGIFHGPFQIEVRGVALALGHGVASRVFVKPLRLKHDG